MFQVTYEMCGSEWYWEGGGDVDGKPIIVRTKSHFTERYTRTLHDVLAGSLAVTVSIIVVRSIQFSFNCLI